MPPSSRPDLRWNSCAESSKSAVCQSAAEIRAGPTDSMLQTTSLFNKSGGRLRAKPDLISLIDPVVCDGLPLPSDLKLGPPQQASLEEWRDGNSTESGSATTLPTAGETVNEIQWGASDKSVSWCFTATALLSKGNICCGVLASDAFTTRISMREESPKLYCVCQKNSETNDKRPIATGRA